MRVARSRLCRAGLLGALLTMAACDEGPAEEAGESVDEAAEEAGEAADDMSD